MHAVDGIVSYGSPSLTHNSSSLSLVSPPIVALLLLNGRSTWWIEAGGCLAAYKSLSAAQQPSGQLSEQLPALAVYNSVVV